MVAKLIKRQVRDDARVIPFIFAAVLILCALSLAARLLSAPLAIVASALSLMLAVGGYFAVLLFIALRFYQTMFGSEGYLTQTLPVRQGPLFAVKAGAGYVESILYMPCLLFAVYVLLRCVADAEPVASREIAALINVPGIGTAIGWLTASLLIQTAEQLMLIYLAITLAHTKPFARYSALSALALFVGIYIINNIVVSIFTLIVPLALSFGEGGITVAFRPMIGDLFNLALSAGSSGAAMPSIGVGGIVFELAASILGSLYIVRLLNRSVNLR